MNRYAVKAIFNTLQGEGIHAGTRAVFLRLIGCNLWTGRPADRDKGRGACARWCDTDFVNGQTLELDQILARMDALWPTTEPLPRRCVITGGEPTLQLDPELVQRLQSEGWVVAVETNGTNDVDALEYIDWLTVSPKLGGELEVIRGDELKVILPGGEPGWREDQLVELGRGFEHCLVQPQDPIWPAMVEHSYLKRTLLGAKPDYESNLQQCIEFVYRHPSWRLGLQLHKLAELP